MKRYLWSWHCGQCEMTAMHIPVEWGTSPFDAALAMHDSHRAMSAECHGVHKSRCLEIIAVAVDHAAVSDA